MHFHPISNCFPLIEGEEFDGLVADVRANGVREPIVLLDGQILDGRNRYRAAEAAGVECPTRDYDGDDPVGFVVSLNLRRRHLSEGQRAWAAAQIARMPSWRPVSAQICALTAQDTAAEMLSVSRRSVQYAAVVRDRGVPELQELVASGEAAVSTAATVARLPEEEQRQVLRRGERLAEALRQKLELDRAIKEANKEARRNRTAEQRHLDEWTRLRDHLHSLTLLVCRMEFPQPPKQMKDDLLARWTNVSTLLSTRLERPE